MRMVNSKENEALLEREAGKIRWHRRRRWCKSQRSSRKTLQRCVGRRFKWVIGGRRALFKLGKELTSMVKERSSRCVLHFCQTSCSWLSDQMLFQKLVENINTALSNFGDFLIQKLSVQCRAPAIVGDQVLFWCPVACFWISSRTKESGEWWVQGRKWE